MNFDEVFKRIHPIVVEAAPSRVSLGCAKEIAEDVAYLITHGYTLNMAKNEVAVYDFVARTRKATGSA